MLLMRSFICRKKDFEQIFYAMEGRPVNIRLLDPPLHEFLPQQEEEIEALAEQLGWRKEKLKSQMKNLYEFNPMLGHRGCRLAITFPAIYVMQAKAISEAACKLIKEHKKVNIEVMLPLVMLKEEFQELETLVRRVFQETEKQHHIQIPYKVGTMVEIPRACLRSGELAERAEFLSFGTNDLTQTTLGLSRDDCGRFLPTYLLKGYFPQDPFVSLDREGVGELVEMGVLRAKKENSSIKIGICGEHGGDPESVAFFHKVGLNYISCSPYRIPIARLAAAQARLKQGG